VSVRRDPKLIPVATVMADPPLEPPGMRAGSCGFRLCGLVTPSANSRALYELTRDDRSVGRQVDDVVAQQPAIARHRRRCSPPLRYLVGGERVEESQLRG
jgi:hypothetical protein